MSTDHDAYESSEERIHGEDGDHQEKSHLVGGGGEDEDFQEKSHLFGREKPVHSALGGGKSADVILWRNKQISAAVLASSTVIWLLFEWLGYHLIPFICHFLILSLATLFLWSNISFFIHKSPIKLPEMELPDDLCNSIALILLDRCNQAIGTFHEVASGKDFKKFLSAIFGLWIVSVVGSWFDFLTVVYIMPRAVGNLHEEKLEKGINTLLTFHIYCGLIFIFLMVVSVTILTMPPLYEKHEDRVDSYAQKAKAKLKRQYSSLDEKVLQKLPKVAFTSHSKEN